MNSEARLMRALGAAVAPAQDPAFTLAVIRAAEAGRFRAAAARSMLRGASLAAVSAALALPFLGWASANSEAFQTGILAAAGILTLVGATRLMTQRAAAAWVR
jgi:hypothetical protein